MVIPVLAIVFTLYFFSTILNSPWTAQVSAFSLGSLLLLFCVIFVAKTVYQLRRGDGTLSFGNIVSRDDLASGRVGLFLATLGFTLLIDYLGFTLTTFLFLLVSMTILARGRGFMRITLVSALMALGGWAVFILAFDTRFPRGWFETTMKAVLANG
ncbi:hypothetical protein BV394_02560 [Brevirhabdus pacifica]|uniref:DUF1468 domain-containing protein n=1 Tax=Brevirhabdus pacifica TaxID=1267768 RepID=A0A1U7DFL5_9RHOB|nr:tripartite tricarboxylate transporter TctB family protein [Brevirhabdus pacifica]APX88751.1 hypothetical protein BV394_02560 [Brevirhabdus pacifica]OWU80006.1 hypothetical protein ATO5_03240 [Loktanella sp. 22II-4b]PJJ86727.1 tripartite tricarboxylate transporter TctB family protein [Brevirhabdus pacifica]